MLSVYSLMVQNLLLLFMLGFLPNVMKVFLISMHNFPQSTVSLLSSFIKKSQNKS